MAHINKFIFTLPGVSTDDLVAFQAAHFDGSQPTVSKPIQINHGFDASEADDELGFYPDGTRRTLTDTQIAIFRHTEIEQLVKSYRHYVNDFDVEEEDEDRNGDLEMSSAAKAPVDFWEYAEAAREKQISDQARKFARPEPEQSSSTGSAPSKQKRSLGDREEKKRESKRAKNKRRKLALAVENRKAAFEDANDESGRTFRRIAREEDEKKAQDVTLDY